ncbi:hypothetical protein [Ramlibacter sp. AN1133]|uniref:hypothetical protein n=1 Tax=Ramlibacter sp. AN1133 TaxID=3133429 RepID=UPI0030BC4320
MTYPDSSYKIYRPKTLPPGLFGETYVIAVGIHTSSNYYKGELFVLTQRPSPRLVKGAFRFSATGVPPELLTVSVEFMLEQAMRQGEIHLIDRLEERAKELARPEILALHLELEECPASPLVSCWLRGQFRDELTDIWRATECASLESHLGLVAQLGGFQTK